MSAKNRKDKVEKKEKKSKQTLEEELSEAKHNITENTKTIALLNSRIIRLESEYKQLFTLVEQLKNRPLIEKQTSDESSETIDSSVFYSPYISQINEWVGSSSYEVIYDSDEHGMTARSYNDKTAGKAKTLTVIQTSNGCVFGHYNSIAIPVSKEDGYGFYMTKDNGFFTFVCKSPLVKTPVKLMRKDPFYSAKVYSCDNEKWVTGIHCGYYVGLGETSFVSGKFHMYFNTNIDNAANIFTGNHFPETFAVFKIVVLQYK